MARTRRRRPETVTPTPREHVGTASMIQRWARVAFVHHRLDPSSIRSLVDPELEIDTFEGDAWVGLVAFEMTMRLPFMPAVPFLSTFPETNVRTYVVDREGRRGLWFLSLDVPRSAAVVVARLALGLPYAWSSMSIEDAGGSFTYRARRRAPAVGARSDVTVEVGGPIPRRDVDALTDFLTARFRLFARGPMGLYRLAVDHPAWPLHAATATAVDDELVSAAGVAVPEGAPLVHFSPGVEVRVGFPHLERGDDGSPASVRPARSIR